MNWGECKLYALQKIDPAVKNLTPTNATKDYLNAIVPSANRGLQDLCTAGKFITKSIEILQEEPKNILADPIGKLEIFTYDGTELAFSADGATSYYFEITKDGEVAILVGDEEALKIQGSSFEFDGTFKAFKGFIPNDDKKLVTLKFGGKYRHKLRNVALYNAKFANEADIWDFVSEKRYDMRKMVSDFYKLVKKDIVLESGYSKVRYKKTTDYFWEGDSTLVLDGLKEGNYKIHYYAYPKEITQSTEDSTELALDPEVAAVLPLYIASELLEDDDSSMAYYVRQQYEEAKKRLAPTRNIGKAQFIDVNGWT